MKTVLCCSIKKVFTGVDHRRFKKDDETEPSARALTIDQSLSDDAVLLMTGMSQNVINGIDEDFKGFIVEDLKKSGKLASMEFIGHEMMF